MNKLNKKSSSCTSSCTSSFKTFNMPNDYKLKYIDNGEKSQAITYFLFSPSDKYLGEIMNDTYTKNVYSSVHFWHKTPSICLFSGEIECVKILETKRVAVYDIENHITYSTNLEKIISSGYPLNENYGNQFCLLLDEWNQNPYILGEYIA